MAFKNKGCAARAARVLACDGGVGWKCGRGQKNVQFTTSPEKLSRGEGSFVLKFRICRLQESRAITRYLSKKQQAKDSDLLGGTVADQAMVDVWCEVEAHQFSAPSSAIVLQIVVIPMKGGKTDEEIVNINVEKLGRVLDVYEQRLAEHNYLVGDFFSLADLRHLPYIHYLVHAAGKREIIISRPTYHPLMDLRVMFQHSLFR